MEPSEEEKKKKEVKDAGRCLAVEIFYLLFFPSCPPHTERKKGKKKENRTVHVTETRCFLVFTTRRRRGSSLFLCWALSSPSEFPASAISLCLSTDKPQPRASFFSSALLVPHAIHWHAYVLLQTRTCIRVFAAHIYMYTYMHTCMQL